jgi:hypothetical protein
MVFDGGFFIKFPTFGMSEMIAMSTQTFKNQGTIQKVSQEYYIPIAANAFILDRKAQNLAAETFYFYKAKLDLFLAFCYTQLIEILDELTPDFIRQWLFHLELGW